MSTRQKLAGALCALAAMGAAGSAAPAGATATGRVHVEGTTIVRADGTPYLWHSVQQNNMVAGDGTNLPDACGHTWNQPPLTDAQDIASLGFNSIRLGIGWSTAEPNAPLLTAKGKLRHAWNETYLHAVDQLVDAASAAGLDVILSGHQSQWSSAFRNFPSGQHDSVCEGVGMPAWLYPNTPEGTEPDQARCTFFTDTRDPAVPGPPQELMADFWKMLAKRYRSNPHVVAADILTEPGWPKIGCLPRTPTGGDLQAFFEKEAKAIRAGNRDLVVIYEEGTWSNYHARGFLLPQKPRIRNAVYGWNYYPDDARDQPALQAHGDRAQSFGQPFFPYQMAFQQGRNNANLRTDPNWDADTRALMAYLKANGVSWTFWAYRPDFYAIGP